MNPSVIRLCIVLLTFLMFPACDKKTQMEIENLEERIADLELRAGQ